MGVAIFCHYKLSDQYIPGRGDELERDEDDDKEMMNDDQCDAGEGGETAVFSSITVRQIENISDVLNNSDDSNP